MDGQRTYCQMLLGQEGIPTGCRKGSWSARCCRHFWPINLNATLKLVLLFSRTHFFQRAQRPHSFIDESLEEGHISDHEFLLYHCTLWGLRKIPDKCSHGSFLWPDACQIKSTLLWNDNKRTLLISHAVRWGGSLKLVVITVPETERVSGTVWRASLCLSHESMWLWGCSVWPVGLIKD